MLVFSTICLSIFSEKKSWKISNIDDLSSIIPLIPGRFSSKLKTFGIKFCALQRNCRGLISELDSELLDSRRFLWYVFLFLPVYLIYPKISELSESDDSSISSQAIFINLSMMEVQFMDIIFDFCEKRLWTRYVCCQCVERKRLNVHYWEVVDNKWMQRLKALFAQRRRLWLSTYRRCSLRGSDYG